MAGEIALVRGIPSRRLRLRYPLLAGALVLVAFVTWNAIPRLVGPPIRQVVVSLPPASHVSVAQVRKAISGSFNGGILSVNLDAVRRRLQGLPWVAQAEVRRKWPDALWIRIYVHNPVARWGKTGLVDAEGEVFGPIQQERFAQLPLLRGPANSSLEVWKDLVRARRILQATPFTIRQLTENRRGSISLKFNSGLRLALGRERPFNRLDRFAHIVVPKLGNALAHAATVDMRYPYGFAVGWKQGSSNG